MWKQVESTLRAFLQGLVTAKEVNKDIPSFLGIVLVCSNRQAPFHIFSLPVLGSLEKEEGVAHTKGSCQGSRKALGSLHQLADFLGAK